MCQKLVNNMKNSRENLLIRKKMNTRAGVGDGMWRVFFKKVRKGFTGKVSFEQRPE